MHAVSPSRGFPHATSCNNNNNNRQYNMITVDKSGRALLTKVVTSSVAT